MSEAKATDWTEADIAAYTTRYGLTNLSPENMERLRELAGVVSLIGPSVGRMPTKEDEPAHVFDMHRRKLAK